MTEPIYDITSASFEAELAAELAALDVPSKMSHPHPHLDDHHPHQGLPLDKREFSSPLQELASTIADIMNSPDYERDKYRDHIHELMNSYDASSNDWRRFEFWDDSKNYTRNLIATDNKTFTLMLLCWNKKKASPIHAHAGSQCWMRVVSGTCRESRYAWPEAEGTPMHLICEGDAKAGETVFINDSMGLHKVENPSDDEPAVSLHLYAPPYQQCKIFLDPSTGRSSTSHVTFYSENGVKVDYY